jgi:tRNA 2-thiouridine synthesizing protein A
MTGRLLRLFGRAPASRRADPRTAAAGSAAISSSERAVATPAGLAPALTIDALGRKCPIPIIMLAEQIRDVPLGAVVAVLADDPAAYTDLPSWCAMKAQEFAGYEELARGWALFIRRMV